MPQRYSGEQRTSEGQKTFPGRPVHPRLPRRHISIPQWERQHPFHRAISYHFAAAHNPDGVSRAVMAGRE